MSQRSFIIKKGGIIAFKEWVYDEEKSKGQIKITDIDSTDKKDAYIMGHLYYDVELEKKFTFRDWFQMILRYKPLQMLDMFFPSYIKEYNKAPNEGCVCDDIKSIVIEKMVEVEEHKNDDEYTSHFCHVYGDPFDNEFKYGLDFVSLNELLDLPLRIDGSVVSISIESKSAVYHHRKTSFSLWDFVHSIIYELSWWGTPENKRKRAEELNKENITIEKGIKVHGRSKV